MIESVEIKNLRGIRAGTLEKLTPLTVLVGPNSSGKSTVLDALLIGTSNYPGDAVGQAVNRRAPQDTDARWLMWRQGHGGAATLCNVKQRPGGSPRKITLLKREEVPVEPMARLRARGCEPPFYCIEAKCETPGVPFVGIPYALTVFAADNSYEVKQEPEALPSVLRINSPGSFIDMRGVGLGTPLVQVYTESVQQGRRDEVRELLSVIVPDLRDIEILVNHRMEPILQLVFADKSVPVTLAGDGVHAMLRLSLELASKSGGLVLIEEPEVHQHPKALQQSAKVLLAGMRRGLQIVLATHSLELIDALLLEATQDDLQHLSTYRLKLSDGILAHSRIDGDRMAFARGQIEEDLR